jgi:hypothetical protein
LRKAKITIAKKILNNVSLREDTVSNEDNVERGTGDKWRTIAFFAFLICFFCITWCIFSRLQFSRISPQGANTMLGFCRKKMISGKPCTVPAIDGDALLIWIKIQWDALDDVG